MSRFNEEQEYVELRKRNKPKQQHEMVDKLCSIHIIAKDVKTILRGICQLADKFTQYFLSSCVS